MRNEKQICMSCIGEFSPKEVYWIVRTVNGRPENSYKALHCLNCIEEKGIEEYEPYIKPRKTKTKVEKPDIKKKKSDGKKV
jgi:hypothetical protein